VYGIYRSPLLALRWMTQDQGPVRDDVSNHEQWLKFVQVCRIQMRFASKKEYESAFNFVRQLGLYMTPSGSTVSTSQTSGPSFPPSDLSARNNRPSTAIGPTTLPLQTQLRDAAARPSSARSQNVLPLNPSILFPRPESAMSVLTNDRFAELQPVQEDAQARPVSATFGLPSASELPPRRELPFPRPDTGGSDGARSGSRPSSSLMGPPQLPTSRAGRQRPTSRAGGSTSSELPPLAKPTPVSKIHTAPQIGASSSKRKLSTGIGETTRPQSAITKGNENQQYAGFPPLFRPVTSDGATNRRAPLSAASDNAQNERLSKPSTVLLTPPTSDNDHQSCSIAEDSNATDAALSRLAVYAKQSDEARVDALNHFLLKHLESNDFLALVDDMDAAWARIVPGFGSAGRHGA